jgi:serine/threonine protein kinase
MSDKDKMNTGGTPLYMPPEMFQLKPETTEKCDVYAFGISKSFDLNELVLELPNS